MGAPRLDFTLHHHGAVDGVTGSCHELRLSSGPGLLVDCGLFQGGEAPAAGGAVDQAIQFPLGHIRALAVTHCHIDHVGRIPHLVAAGFKGPILCSHPTAELLPLVLEDAVAMGITRDRDLLRRFLELIRRRLRPLQYGHWTPLDLGGAGLDLRLRPAGHILGSAYLECRLPGGVKVLFSGDLGPPNTPLLPPPTPPYGCDSLVIEATYGDRLHGNRRDRQAGLQAVIERALADRGAVLIPAFSIGRTQELLYELEGIIHRQGGKAVARGLPWKELDIVVDSPLAARFTAAYRRLRPWWDQEARTRVRAGRHPLSFEQLITIDSHSDHLRLVEHLRSTGRPTVVIAASGMCAGGRIVDYLKALLGDLRTDVVFVGYQARGTPGREIQTYGSGGGCVRLDGERIPIRARIHTLEGYSAHADRDDLLRFVRRMRRPPAEIRIVHGDLGAKRALAEALQTHCPGSRILIPDG
jgi:metallo-beta-lactamase family protein